MRKLFFFLGILLFMAACKVQKTQRSQVISPDEADTVMVVQAPEVVEIDTVIVPPPDTVEIGIHRLLPPSVRIMGVGDMMIGTNFPDASYLPPDSAKHVLAFVADSLALADLTFGNLEGVLLNGEGTPKNCKDPNKCYVFRMPGYMADRFSEAGFDVLSVANNHSGDFGDEGRRESAKILTEHNIQFAGYDSKPYTVFRKKEIVYGFAAFAPNKGTASIHNLPEAVRIVQHLDSLADIVIVSFHGGAEGKDHEHVTRETEMFYGENRGNVYAFSHALVDAGADVIFGHGPHVVRAVEVYKNRFIAYSLGNFSTYRRFNLRGPNAYAPIVDITTTPTGEFMHGKIISAIQTGLGIPKVDSQNRAARRMKELLENDFPEAEIFIEGSGVISYIKK